MAFPTQFERSEASHDAIQLFGGAHSGRIIMNLSLSRRAARSDPNDGELSSVRELAQGLVATVAANAIVDLTELLQVQHGCERMPHTVLRRRLPKPGAARWRL